jgi:malonyl-CoA O-methyltransferase
MNLAKKQIAHQFSRAAKTYDAAANLQNEMAARLIDQIAYEQSASGQSRLGRTLVDLGCGTGAALLNIASRFDQLNLIAVDIAPGMIEVAKERLATSSVAATFHCCDLESTPLASDSADIVFSNAAIQWCDPASAIGEMRRICRGGGSIFLSTFGPGTCREIQSAWDQVDDSRVRVHEFSAPEQLEQHMLSTGLRDVAVQSENRELTFDSVDSFLQSLKQIGATYASSSRQQGLMGTNRYRKFRSVLTDRLTTQGKLTLTFHCVFATAKK